METKELIINFDNPPERGTLLQMLRSLSGKWRIELCRYRKRRSDRQNRWYWSCFVQAFGDYLRAQGNDFTDEMAHEVLKAMFLQSTVLNKETGELYTYTRSTTELSTIEFNEYLDRCAAFLAIECGIIVPEPNVYREREAA